jgi:hypothetical protein
MLPYKDNVEQSILEKLYSKQHKKNRFVFENSLGILKKKLFHKTKLHVAFVFNMIVCCCILHNLVLGQNELDIVNLMH